MCRLIQKVYPFQLSLDPLEVCGSVGALPVFALFGTFLGIKESGER